jgi:hypothetical protein
MREVKQDADCNGKEILPRMPFQLQDLHDLDGQSVSNDLQEDFYGNRRSESVRE